MKCLIFNNDEVIDYIIKYALKRSNRYEVYYPKGEYEEDNPLFNHKKFFVNDAEKVASWDGMKDSEVISGRLCDCSKKLIYKAEKSFEKIWKFNLLYNTDIILSVDDFDTCVLFAEDDIKNFPNYIKRQVRV